MENQKKNISFPETMPKELQDIILSWDYVSQSPHSNSYYNCKGKTWDYTAPNCIRVADHWNFTTIKRERDILTKDLIESHQLHAKTDIPVKSNKEWAIGKYNSNKGIYEIIKKFPLDSSFKEKIKKEILYTGKFPYDKYEIQKLEKEDIVEVLLELFKKSILTYSKAVKIINEEGKEKIKKYKNRKDLIFVGIETENESKDHLKDIASLRVASNIKSENLKQGYFNLPIYYPIYPQRMITHRIGEIIQINAPDTVFVIDKNSNVIDILYRVEYRSHYQGWFEYKNKDSFKALIEWEDIIDGNRILRKIRLYDYLCK